MISEEKEETLATRKTKGAKGGGTIRQRPDGRWEARYTLGIDPKTGKQIQKSVYGKTQKEVRQKLTAITAEIDDGTYMEPCRMTLDEWLDIRPRFGQCNRNIRTTIKTKKLWKLSKTKNSEANAPCLQLTTSNWKM